MPSFPSLVSRFLRRSGGRLFRVAVAITEHVAPLFRNFTPGL
jgi:hypothetical protein